MKFILIDGSYFIFYRYHALLTWWKCAKTDTPLENPYDNIEFLEKFRKTFVDKLKEIPLKVAGIKKKDKERPVIIVGKDCPRENIWRTSIYPEYKGTRKSENYISQFFKLVYNEGLFSQHTKAILEHPNLEADDCLALTTKRILETRPDDKVYIITSDMDYLQLAQENKVELWNLKYKKLTDAKSSFNDSKKDLFFKIMLGDKSDNILPVLKQKGGPKEVQKCFDDEEYFKTRLQDKDNMERYTFNKTLIDFVEIPETIINEFKNSQLLINN